MIYIGIDPGKTGAMAILDGEGIIVEILEYSKFTLNEFAEALKVIDDPHCFTMIEEVKAMPGNGGTSMFNFGKSYGEMIGIMCGAFQPFELVLPTKWQKEFGLIRKKTRGGNPESSTDKKNRHKVVGSRLFPKTKMTHAITDALLIAEYCRRQRTGTLTKI